MGTKRPKNPCHALVIVLPPKLFTKDDVAVQVFDLDSIFGELDEAVANT